ncbi:MULTISPECIES: ABC transporter ATP-binding protein [unclassified Streptosporangium]|uniref:ABC transporter ATP-binding protein n=1 Tax=Streptosporangium sp. NPDC005286 TaxID=3154463 RepID=UPI0033A1F578
MSAPILQVRQLSAGYGDLAAVHGIDLVVHSGEIVALFGPNGAGKTTTLLTIAGELPGLGGEVRLFGAPTKAPVHHRARQGLAFVPEERAIVPGMSTRDNLRLGRGGVDRAVAVFPELGRLLDRPAGLLSGGEQQMLVLARCIATEPRLLLADELSLGLAPLVVNRLMDTLRRVVDEHGVGVLLVEQQAKRALSVADRWYLLRQGEIAATGDQGGDWREVEEAYFGTRSHPQELETP